MKKNKGKKANDHLRRAAKGLFGSEHKDKDDGMAPCPYCGKKFDALSMHQYKCPLGPSDEKDVKNSAVRPSSHAETLPRGSSKPEDKDFKTTTKGPTPAADIDGKVPCPNEHLRMAAKGLFYADNKDNDKDDGMVPCPYCHKKFEPLSMHPFKCQSKPSDGQIVKNATKELSCGDAEDEDEETEYFFYESDESQDAENDGRLLSPSDEEEVMQIREKLYQIQQSRASSKNKSRSNRPNSEESEIDPQSENDFEMSYPWRTYDEEVFKKATEDLTWIDSEDSSGEEYHRPFFTCKPYDDDHIIFYEKKGSSADDSDEYSDQEGYVFKTPKCLKEVMATMKDVDKKLKEYSSGEEDEDEPGKREVIIKEAETEYCLEKINALMGELLQKLNDQTKLLWVKMNSGSHYSNVKLPNEMEFDYMLCPTQVQCRIEPSSDHPCYCRVFITNKYELPLEFQEILGPQDELTPSNFKGYVFPILEKITPEDQPLNRVENKSMCPAYTVDYKIGRSRLNRELCIDWVPCLEVQDPPECYREWKTRLLTEEEKESCPLYVVAKNFDDDGEELELWRLSFSVIEMKILRDKCNEQDRNIVKVLKHIMKLVRKENDENKPSIKMCSYHVMSQCLRYFEETTQRPTGKSYLLDMIDHLIIAVHSKEIRHFFIPSFNLMHDVDYEECQNFDLRLYYYRKAIRQYKSGRQITPIIKLCGQLGLIKVKKAGVDLFSP